MKYFLLILVLVLSSRFAFAAQPSNKNRFIQLLESKLGDYRVVEANSGLCVDNALAFLQPSDPEQGFMLGEDIIVGPFHNGTQTTKKEGFCFITSSFKYKSNGLIHSIKTSRCESPSDVQTLTQQFIFSAENKLDYTLLEQNISCSFVAQ